MNEELISFSIKNATHRLILLHGWGADAGDLLPFAQELVGSIEKKIELLSLNAPDHHPQGVGRQWYKLFPTDWSEASVSVENLKKRLIELSSEDMPLSKTFLLGFSQGAAMALASGSCLPFAGLISCSGFPHQGWNPTSNCPPVLLIHGEQDPVVPIKASQRIADLLEIKQLKYEFTSFQGGHEIPDQAINKITNFIYSLVQT
mgnify:CR=1 FL=1